MEDDSVRPEVSEGVHEAGIEVSGGEHGILGRMQGTTLEDEAQVGSSESDANKSAAVAKEERH